MNANSLRSVRCDATSAALKNSAHFFLCSDVSFKWKTIGTVCLSWQPGRVILKPVCLPTLWLPPPGTEEGIPLPNSCCALREKTQQQSSDRETFRHDWTKNTGKYSMRNGLWNHIWLLMQQCSFMLLQEQHKQVLKVPSFCVCVWGSSQNLLSVSFLTKVL